MLLRLEEVQPGEPAPREHDTSVGAPAVAPSTPPTRARTPRAPADRPPAPAARRRRIRRAGALLVVLAVLGVIGAAAYLAVQSVYFIGTNARGLVTLYRGLPFSLPGGLALYSSDYVSGVSASTLTPARRHTLLDHSLRSEKDAASLIQQPRTGPARMRAAP